MITKEMLEEVFKRQEEFNCLVNPDWKNAGYDYEAAFIFEGVELFNHFNWKWWAKEKPVDMQQVKLELADMLCFAVSDAILFNYLYFDDEYELYDRMNSAFGFLPSGDEVTEKFKWFIQECCDSVNLLMVLAHLCKDLEISLEEILTLHLQKTTLNIFRQKHGYKEGTYNKMWRTSEHTVVEDNVMLSKICEGLPEVDKMNTDKIYAKLKEYYVVE